MLADISDVRVRASVVKRGRDLSNDPLLQGKALKDDLAGFRSVRAASQRYRIVYVVGQAPRRVGIVWLGIRRDGGKTDVYYTMSRHIKRKGRDGMED